MARATSPKTKSRPGTAESMAKGQRDISISEFFAKNRHLLGFDNPRRALLTTIKEAVDNALDACEEAEILPTVHVTIQQTAEDRFIVKVRDNGPGIVKAQIPNIFGKLLYGSKFHRLRMSRGQQGIGISAAGMYGLLTTGKSVKITSRISPRKPAHYYEIQIDTKKNRPEIIRDMETEWNGESDPRHGTEVEIELQARYTKGRQSVDEYLSQTAIANPHVTLAYTTPDGETVHWERSTKEMPARVESVKPHPYGVELGVLIKMLKDAKGRSVRGFLQEDFSRISAKVAAEICELAKISASARPSRIGRHEADALYAAIQQVKIMNPSANCVAPIGEELIVKGLQQVHNAEFYASTTRPPAVYRGNPFIVEAGIAYGGELGADELLRLYRFANRVPLLYQQGACSCFKAAVSTSWRNYHLQQSRGALPSGPIALMIHVASVWVPFTSESKEAVAHYPEIIKEIRLACQECGRKLGLHLSRRKREAAAKKRLDYLEIYVPHIGEALQDILGLKENQVGELVENLEVILRRPSSDI